MTASGNIKPLSYVSFSTVLLPSDDVNQNILFSASGTQLTLDYRNLLKDLNNKYLTRSSNIIISQIPDLATTVASYGYVNAITVAYDPANNINMYTMGNALVVDYTNLLNNLALLAPLNNPTFPTRITTPALTLGTQDLATQLATYAPRNNPTFTGTVSGITAAMVGLGNVNNTSDANKPISTATQAALNLIASLTAPIASPTFTGTATAPTVNATTSLQVGGIDISTIYQTLGGMSSYITSSSLATTLTSYLTTATASTTYQTTANMSNYLTTATASSTYAPKASPTFTGTATAPTINATTALQVNGTNINTIYQTIANMSSYLTTTTASTTYAPLASPALTGTATAANITATGTITAPTINATTTLQINGVSATTALLVRPWAQGYVPSAGTTVTNQVGLKTASCSKGGTGIYNITFAAFGNNSFSSYATLYNAIGFITISSQNTGGDGIVVKTYNSSGSAADAGFFFMVIAQ